MADEILGPHGPRPPEVAVRGAKGVPPAPGRAMV
jgi:hypothetical protein